MTTKQVLLVKYLLKQANDTFHPEDAFACGLAISLLQDSVETMMWTIAKTLEAPVKDRDSFEKIWDSIPRAKKNTEGKELPLRAHMIDLNRARVNFKHYENLPDSDDALKFIGYTEEFLRRVSTDLLSIDFDDVSLSDLISNNDVKNIINKGEQEFKNQNWKEAITMCAHAELAAVSSLKIILPRAEGGLSRISAPTKQVEFGLADYSVYLRALWDMSVINLSGVKLSDYIRFKSLIPDIYISL